MAPHPLHERLGLPRSALPWASLGTWPSPLTSLALDGETLWVKREDLSHAVYGGNKVRTLEVLLGDARARGVTRVWAAGAYGSNHAVATLVHAPRVGLTAGALLFPQPMSAPARENLLASASMDAPLVAVPHVALLPWAMLSTWRAERRRGHRPWMMPPGGATALGALGALSAVFELAEQLAAHAAPPPSTIVVAAGSGCTSAGLLAGLALARHVGAWRWPVPVLHAVRVTPWPVTARMRIAALAARALALLERFRRGPALTMDRAALARGLTVDGSQLGAGYGSATSAGDVATRAFARAGGPPLDCVYTAKAVAGLRELARRRGGRPLLYWSTKSAAPPPTGELRALPPALARWLTAGPR